MLSERERRTFLEIEQQILGEDPRFVASMRRLLSGRGDRRTCLVYDVIIVVAAVSAVLCLTLSSPGAGFVAGGLAAVTLHCRPGRAPWPRARRRPRRGAAG
jgi:hypothetical protein